MIIYLAGTSTKPILPLSEIDYVLESFYYFESWQLPYLNDWKEFLLDSGAYTFMSKNKSVKWGEYVQQYAEFINSNKINRFFELDIDNVIGLQEVEKLRQKLESCTGKQSIPVWHRSRGVDNFIGLTKDYNLIAIGGIVAKEITQKDYPYLKWFIDKAHDNSCKIHGLGFTAINQLKVLNFDSVDSTSWQSGGRFGQLHQFKKGNIVSINYPNKRAKDYKQIDLHNMREWIKFQKYAKIHL